MHKKIGLQLFSLAYKLLQGKGLWCLPLAKRTYDFLYSYLVAGKGIVLADVHGHKMYLDSSDKYGVSSVLVLGGIYEKYETHLFETVVGEGMTVVDLGANIGYYTLLAAKLVDERGKVFAFEPDPRNFTLLLKNVKANRYHNIIPEQKAVSNKTGTTKLFLSRENKGDPRIYDCHDGREYVQVDVTTLDEFFNNKGCQIDVIKMDIQGAEMAAIEGMTRILLNNDTLKIITEFFPEGLRGFGFSPRDFLNKLVGYGFRLYTITAEEPWIKPASITHIMRMAESKQFINLFCQKTG